MGLETLAENTARIAAEYGMPKPASITCPQCAGSIEDWPLAEGETRQIRCAACSWTATSLRRQDKVRQGISRWQAVATNQWALRPDQEPAQPAPDVEKIIQLAQFAQRCEDGWRQWFTSTGIQPCHVLYEDLARDRLAVTNKVLEYLRLPQLDAGDLPPVRYRKQADSLTERYADLVRSAMNSRSTRDP